MRRRNSRPQTRRRCAKKSLVIPCPVIRVFSLLFVPMRGGGMEIFMKITVLDAATLGNDLSLSPLSRLGETEIYQMSDGNEVLERIRECDVVILNKIKIHRENLISAKNLKLICVLATGYDNIDLSSCKEKGIAVCNVTAYSTHSVAQLTLAMALSLSVNLPQFNRYVKSGEYTKSGVQNHLNPAFYELAGKTWGIIGLGNIGRQVAKAAEAMDCKVIACKRSPDVQYNRVSIDKLCRESDIISVHLPLTPETHHLINRRLIDKMKPGVIFINVARGAVADEAALAGAVTAGKIGGLGIDVYSTEPFPESHPYNKIMHLDSVCMTPHMAWGAYEARVRCLNETIRNITAFYKGEIRNRVDLKRETS
jgi:lactate dehydrogenase-like 2-hydroxyacid dehydrogenase